MSHAVRWLLTAVLLVAFGLRVISLYDLPPGFTMDEGFYALDGLAALNGDIQPFYAANGGRESLFMIVMAPFIAILGRDPLAARLPAAFFGVLTVAVMVPLGRRLFRGSHQARAEWIGLAAATLVAGSLWLILYNRIGLRVNTYPFVVGVAAYAFWRAWEDQRARDWVWAGLAFGLAQYTYTAARVLPIVIPGYVGLRVLLDGSWAPLRARWREWAVFGVVAAIAIAPLATYAVTHPADFLRRQAKLSPLNAEQAEGQHPVERFTEALVGTLPMFTLRGDERALRNLPGRPVFDALMAPFFFIGLGLTIWRFRRPASSFVLLWFGVMLLASAVPLGLVPHNTHAFAMLPVLFLFPALGLVETATLAMRRGLWRPVVAGVASALVMGSVGWAAVDYFRVYPTLTETYFQYDADVVDTVNQMNDRGHDPRVAFVVAVGKLYPERYQHGTFSFLYKGAAPWRFVRVDEASVAHDLAAAVGDKRSIVRFERTAERETPPDNKDVVDFLLQRQGRMVSDEFYRGFRVTAYTVDGPLWPTLAPTGERPAPPARFGDALRLTTWAAGPSADRSTVWAIARWQAVGPMAVAYKASVRLHDAAGNTVALADRDLIRAPFFESTVGWDVGDTEASYHLLRLPTGLPPGDYTLTALVYDAETGKPLTVNGGVELALGAVTLDALTPGALDPDVAIPRRGFGPVALVGLETPDAPVKAGGVAPVTLYWQATAPTPNATVQVRLVGVDGATVSAWAGTPLAGQFPPERWPTGAIVQHTIRLPVDAAADGPTRMELQWGQGDPQPIGVVTIAGRARQYAVPPIARPLNAPVGQFGTLLGWNPGPDAAGTVAIDLVWQATARADRSWTVFVHLIGPDNRIVAQVDRVPAGDSPTTSWLPGEIVIDRVRLMAPPGGRYRVRVGMYDARTGNRVPIGSGDQVEFAVGE